MAFGEGGGYTSRRRGIAMFFFFFGACRIFFINCAPIFVNDIFNEYGRVNSIFPLILAAATRSYFWFVG